MYWCSNWTLKETRNSYFCVTPKNNQLTFSHKKYWKALSQESNCVFFNLGEKKILKVAAFTIFTTSIMALLEIHQRFKGQFLNELRISFDGLKQSLCKTPSSICTKSVTKPSVNIEVLKQQNKFLAISRISFGTWWCFKTQLNYGILPQMHYKSLKMSQLRIVDLFVHY